MIIKDNAHPDDRLILPDRRKYTAEECTTRPMTKEEIERYGKPSNIPPNASPSKVRKGDTERLVYYETGELPDYVVALSERSRRVRAEKNLKQRDVAEIAGVSHFTVSALESLKKFPRQSSLDKIRAGLDVIEGKEMAK